MTSPRTGAVRCGESRSRRLFYGALRRLLVWYITALRWNQRVKPDNRCAHFRCRRDWIDHVGDLRMCKYHHPEYETPVEDLLRSL